MTSVQRQPAAPQLNGNASYGANVNKALVQEERIEKSSVQKLSKEHDIVLKTFRILIADLCSAFNMGHPGYVEDILRYLEKQITDGLQWCHWYGRHWCGSLEIPNEVCTTLARLVQQRPLCALKWSVLTLLVTRLRMFMNFYRTHLPLPILLPPFFRLQSYGLGDAQVIPLRESR